MSSIFQNSGSAVEASCLSSLAYACHGILSLVEKSGGSPEFECARFHSSTDLSNGLSSNLGTAFSWGDCGVSRNQPSPLDSLIFLVCGTAKVLYDLIRR